MLFILSIFLIGLFFGSFFGVLVNRLTSGKSFVKGRSKCDFCKKELSFFDLIPVLSFILSNGRCRYCHKKLTIFYPLIEISAGFIFVLSYLYSPLFNSFGNINFSFFYFLFIFSSFLVLLFQDLKYGILSDKIIFLTTGISFFYFILFQKQEFINHFLSGVSSFLFFVLISAVFYVLTKKQGMGGGDIKLSFLLGFLLGFPGVIICFYLAFLTGAIASIILVLWRKKDYLKDSLPFGPFLIIGAYISLFWGNLIFIQVLKLLGA